MALFGPSFLARFLKNQDGSIIAMSTIMIPLLIGVVGLSLDVGRVYYLQHDLQELADAAALAGAKELDGLNGAISRATDKANNLLNNDPTWSNVALAGAQIASVTFYSDISTGGDTLTADDTKAAYVKVTTVTRGMASTFIQAVGTGGTINTSSSAMAGSLYIACGVSPLLLCNPFENGPGGTVEFKDAVNAGTVTAGMQFNFTPKAANGSFAPGDFGLLDPPGQNSNGANGIRNLLSQQTPNFCYVHNVSPRPGQIQNKVMDGINVRFDIPASTGNTNGMDQSPAPVVTKGERPVNPNNCNSFTTAMRSPPPPPPLLSTFTTIYPYPDDTSLTAYGALQIGNGVLNTTNAKYYWQQHHDVNATQWPTTYATRYQAYQAEVAGSVPWVANEPYELHAPLCSSSPTNVAARRLVTAAVVDCIANGVNGNSATNLVSSSIAEFFITKPADATIYTEFTRIITPPDDRLHHIVQLVR